jgi:hypothetical protein
MRKRLEVGGGPLPASANVAVETAPASVLSSTFDGVASATSEPLLATVVDSLPGPLAPASVPLPRNASLALHPMSPTAATKVVVRKARIAYLSKP